MESRLPDDIRQQYARLAQLLVDEFKEKVDAETVAQCVSEHLNGFQDARVLNFVPILVYRYAREELSERSA